MSKTDKILSKVNYPKDIKKLSISDLNVLAGEIREMIIKTVSKTGGHLGANLGVVEMTIALHYVFNMPYDKIIWDVGHQCYTHKILTGRKDKMSTLRQPGGISGFPKMFESPYDSFGTGHSSTSISAALGMAVARDLGCTEKDRNIIAVIGDGAMSGGMAYEAMNNAGELKNKIIVVLNDNDMSISKPVGAMSKYLSKLIASKSYLKFRKTSKSLLKYFPGFLTKMAQRFEKSAKDVLTGGNIFEELGFYYVGPIDGHNIEEMISIFENVKNEIDKPILIHCRTEKGRGFEYAVKASNKLHSIGKFDIDTGEEINKKGQKTFSEIFGETLCEIARKDNKVVAITAAMTEGTGLAQFAKEFPDRFFDVGIAEEHAVTFAAGLTTQGYKPFVAIYSSFLQRAFDQIIHDVWLQNLPVRFAIDRAGLALEDGPTHDGIYDKILLSKLKNFEILEPETAKELKEAIYKASEKDNGPIAIRYTKSVAK